MPETKKIIEMILSDEKLKNSRSFSSSVYKDEPIIKKASEMNGYVPPKIAELQDIIRKTRQFSATDAKGFYKQAKFMEDYEDDYDYKGEFSCYYPTYRSMNTRQLRGYFSWRTRVRKGDVRKTSLSFAFVYIYELLHLVGASSAEDGFEKLSRFNETYGELDCYIKPYVNRWLRDFAIFYNLDKTLFCSVSDTSADEALIAIANCKNISDEDLFDAVKCLSSYNIANSKLYKTYPEECQKIVCSVYRDLCAYSDKHNKKSLFESYFGYPVPYYYEMFGTAVFYDSRSCKNSLYIVNDVHKYECTGSVWICKRFPTIGRRSKKLGILVKSIDSIMRKKFGISHDIDQPVKTKRTIQTIEKEIDALLEEKEKNTPAKIDLDLSKLKGIRMAAEITRDKLLTESETEDIIPDAVPAVPEETGSDSNLPLDENEYELLRCLLYGINTEPLRSRGVMLSVLADSVNDKLFDMFEDTVIAFDGDSPEIIEDYADELKGIVKK